MKKANYSFEKMVPAYAVILWQIIAIGRPQDVIPALRALHPGLIAIGLALLASVIYWQTIPGPSIFQHRTIKHLRNIVLLMIVLIPFSIIPPKAVNYIVNDFSITVAFYLVFCQFIRTFRQLKLSVIVFIFSSTVLAVPMIIRGDTASRLSTGTMYDPNDIAMLFLVTLPFAIYSCVMSKGLLRLLLLLSVPILLFAIVLTQSRGAFVGCTILLIFWIIKSMKPHSIVKFSKKIIIVILIISIGISFSPASFKERIGTILDPGTGSGRTTVWSRAITMMLWYPHGVGPGSFTSVYGRHLSAGDFPSTDDVGRERAWMTAHNSYLLVGVELGFIGLALYLFWLINMIKDLSILMKINEGLNFNRDLFLYCSMMKFSLLGFMITAFFLSQSFSYILFCLSGYIVALKRLANETEGFDDPH